MYTLTPSGAHHKVNKLIPMLEIQSKNLFPRLWPFNRFTVRAPYMGHGKSQLQSHKIDNSDWDSEYVKSKTWMDYYQSTCKSCNCC